MSKTVRDGIIEIAKHNGDDVSILSERGLWEYVRDHWLSYLEFFGKLYAEGDMTQPFTITLKKYCPECELNLLDFEDRLKHLPKYDNEVTLTLRQDWWGGNVWHIYKVEWGRYSGGDEP